MSLCIKETIYWEKKMKYRENRVVYYGLGYLIMMAF